MATLGITQNDKIKGKKSHFFKILQNKKIQCSYRNKIWKKNIGLITSDIFLRFINFKSALSSLLNNHWFSVSAKIKKNIWIFGKLFFTSFSGLIKRELDYCFWLRNFSWQFYFEQNCSDWFFVFFWPPFNVSYFN